MQGPYDKIEQETDEPTPLEGNQPMQHIPSNEELERLMIARTLELEGKEEMIEHQDRIKKLQEYARARGASDISDIVNELRSLRNRLGHGANIHEMVVYANLEMNRLELQSKMDKMEATHGPEA